ncbi:YHS domain-containing (seleno)protein [Histidinibacterium lentulum]|uniref:YHS domain protein n=1 Tax=Histidinibacterium lentulum TaxID=2480588 RepID=A0A3N2QYJ7_9RHOB|nr:YHS domain-containing (seleno)protein [Histidinibacterium lentulum]ROU00223.1 YHS domain protein [Histidinibacterium lentulum]
MIPRRRVLALAAALPASLAAGPALAREPDIFTAGGRAIHGVDPVAYFDLGGPVEGGTESLVWRGAEWAFAGAGNRATFEADPERWAPAFGGYCAWAASRGYLAPTVPDAWTVHEGRLYLNASLRIRDRWLGEIDANIARGEANWPGILG